MRGAWSSWGSFDAAVWEQRMARPVVLAPPEDHAPRTYTPVHTPRTMNHAARTPRLERACDLLRNRLNRLEDPPGPLSARQKRLLSRQTNRLSRLVEAMIYASQDHEGDRHAA